MTCPECHHVHERADRCGHTPDSDGGLMLVGPCWCNHRQSRWPNIAGWGLLGVVVLVVATLALFTSTAGSATPNGCTAEPGKVTKTQHGVHAGAVTIVCQGHWQANQAVLWADATGDWVARKWSYGGDRDSTGTGSMAIRGFTRPYHHDAWWKQRVTLDGRVFDGPITKFRSG